MHTLIVHEAFLNSSVIPKECLFTGRTDQVKLAPLFLRGNAPHPDNPRFKPFCSFPVMIPHAPGKLFLWQTITSVAYFKFALAILYGVIVGIHLVMYLAAGTQNPEAAQSFFIDLGIFLAYLTWTLVLRWYCRWKLVGIGIQSTNSLIYLRFPPERGETAQHFLDAYNRFLAAHEMPPATLLSDDDEWHDSASAGWDQIRANKS